MMQKNITSKENIKADTCLAKILALLMQKADISTYDLSRHTGIPQPTINRLRTDSSCNPTVTTLLPIANFFKITINQLLGIDEIQSDLFGTINPNQVKYKKIPVIPLDSVATNLAEQLLDHYQLISTSADVGADAFAIIAKGSLITPQFPENSYLIFDRYIEPADRDYVITVLEGHTKPVMRQLIIDGNDHYLKPLNLELGEIAIHPSQFYLAVLVQALFNYRR
jgi:SOS-response transcriptional repressor LexA